jgi:hypothetical protein
VRVKYWACVEEQNAGQFEARRGDVLLQSSLLTVAIRSPWVSLTRLDEPGGTLVDAAPAGDVDWVLEAIPDFDGQPTGLTLLEDGVAVDGTSVVWRLDPDEPRLFLEGSPSLELQGDRRHEPVGPGFYRDDQRVLTDGTVLEDTGGTLLIEGVTSFWIGDRQDIHARLYDTFVSGTCEGDRVEARLDGETVAWLAADFEDHVPAGSELVCVAEGHADGQPSPTGTELTLSPGDGGLVWVRVGGPEDIPAVVETAEGRWPVKPGGDWIPATGPARIHHGPGWSVWEGELQEENEVALVRRVPEDWLLVDLYREAMPSVRTRIEAGDELQLAAAEGVGFAVQSAPDEVGRPYTNDWFAREMRAVAGSWAVTDDYGTVLAWPVSRNARRAAHGAVPWHGLGPLDLLAVARDPARRLVAVDPTWVQAAGPSAQWNPLPDLLRVSGAADLPMVSSLLDADLSIGLLGPSTWLPIPHFPLPGVAEVERALLMDRSVASSGPVLTLTPREQLGPLGAQPLDITLFAGEGDVALVVDGVEVARNRLNEGDTWRVEVRGERWALALLDDQDWAFSAAVSLR